MLTSQGIWKVRELHVGRWFSQEVSAGRASVIRLQFNVNARAVLWAPFS